MIKDENIGKANPPEADIAPSISDDGLDILVALTHIEPRQTVVYHVGLLPQDYQGPPSHFRLRAYRLAPDVADQELETIHQRARSIEQEGQCKLLELSIEPGVLVVYIAVGV